MKNPSPLSNLLIACALSLSACGSGSSPGGGGAAVVPVSACPELNGEYAKQISANESQSFTIHSKREEGKLLYSFDEGEKYFEANAGGAKHVSENGESGTVAVNCNADSLTLLIVVDNGPTITRTFKVASENTIAVTGSGEVGDGELGAYTKQ